VVRKWISLETERPGRVLSAHAGPDRPRGQGPVALVLGDDGEAPAQIGQPAIVEGADLVRSNVEGGAPFDGEAFEARPLGGDHALPLFIDGSLRTGTQSLPTD
jgi:hypothetical protein